MGTQTTIRIRGREYGVERTEKPGRNEGEVEAAYRLVGKRGALYQTMRNVHHADRLFLFDARGLSPVMNGVWLSDASGRLEVVSQ